MPLLGLQVDAGAGGLEGAQKWGSQGGKSGLGLRAREETGGDWGKKPREL